MTSMHSKLRWSSPTGLVALDVDAVEEIFERTLLDLEDGLASALSRLGHAKQTAIKPLVTQHELQALRTQVRALCA